VIQGYSSFHQNQLKNLSHIQEKIGVIITRQKQQLLISTLVDLVITCVKGVAIIIAT